MIYESIILELFILLFAFYSHCGDKRYELFQITCLKERKNMGVEDNLGYQ